MSFRILQLCHRVPYPPVDGGSIAMYNLAKSLAAEHCMLKVLAINTSRHQVDVSKIPQSYFEMSHLESVDVDTSIKISSAFLNLFSSQSYNVTRFISKTFEHKLIDVLKKEEFDIIQFESLFVTSYLHVVKKYSKAKTILRAHNVEFKIWERLTANNSSSLKKPYLKLLTRRLKKFELEQTSKFDALLPITPHDAKTFLNYGIKIPMHVVPVGVDFVPEKISTDKINQMSLFHLGSMDWMPNVEAVTWFLDNVWMKLHSLFPQLQLHLAGRGFPEEIKERNDPNVFCETNVADAIKYMSDKNIMIVPLLSGSGMRVKIIQGMAAGKTIISTAIGAEGIEYENEKNILIADTPKQFVSYVAKCLEDHKFCNDIGNAAQTLVKQHYYNATIAKWILDFYKSL